MRGRIRIRLAARTSHLKDTTFPILSRYFRKQLHWVGSIQAVCRRTHKGPRVIGASFSRDHLWAVRHLCAFQVSNVAMTMMNYCGFMISPASFCDIRTCQAAQFPTSSKVPGLWATWCPCWSLNITCVPKCQLRLD